MTNSIQLAIAALIVERSQALKLSRSDLVRRAGFKNVAKGLRRLDELCAGEVKSTTSLIAGLPAALEVPPEAVGMLSGGRNNKLPRRNELPNRKRRPPGGPNSGPVPTSWEHQTDPLPLRVRHNRRRGPVANHSPRSLPAPGHLCRPSPRNCSKDA